MDEGGDDNYSSVQWSIVAIFISMVVLLIVLGYVWIIVTVARTRSLHTASNCFLASLAVSLVIIGLVGTPSVIFFTAVKTFTSTLIFTLSWTMSFCVIGFFLNAILLAADKWLKISRPFLYARVVTRNKCALCLSVIWATTLLWSLIMAIVHLAKVNPYGEHVYQSFSLLSVVFGYGVITPSVIVITALNIGIHRIARQQARAILPAVQQQQQPRVENAAVAGHQPLPEFANQQRGIHTKSTRQFSIFLLSFTVAWFPLAVLLHILYVTRATQENRALVVALMIYTSGSVGQSALGTLILTFLQREYRQILKRNFRTVFEKMHCIKRR